MMISIQSHSLHFLSIAIALFSYFSVLAAYSSIPIETGSDQILIKPPPRRYDRTCFFSPLGCLFHRNRRSLGGRISDHLRPDPKGKREIILGNPDRTGFESEEPRENPSIGVAHLETFPFKSMNSRGWLPSATPTDTLYDEDEIVPHYFSIHRPRPEDSWIPLIL
ncbi:unnamed protein product, partial [Mesorhabditis belari]|uniref:Uncharacterized protein n=1 Tax=Mesorhabditis belari TaxID=2138241 RepID=A0AAF3J5Y7_9BILA